jgi:hypothetical protein
MHSPDELSFLEIDADRTVEVVIADFHHDSTQGTPAEYPQG